jgi:hypothetical protein
MSAVRGNPQIARTEGEFFFFCGGFVFFFFLFV